MTESEILQATRKARAVTSASRNSQNLSNQPERLARLHAMVEDEAPIEEIKETLGMSYTTIKKYAPGAGWRPGAPAGHKAITRLKREVGL